MYKVTLLGLLLFLLNNALWSQIFYLQPFASSTFPAGWSSNDSRIVINNQAPSSGYNPPPASGGFNVRMEDCLPMGETPQLTVSGVISTVGRTGIRVGFGRRRSAAHATPVLFEWSSNGTTWNTISTDVAAGATNTWDALFFDLPAAAENVPNLRFRFSYVTEVNMNCTTPPNFRIDDFAVGENFSLPVELVRFDVRPEAGRNWLFWATASEHNSAWFEVERSGEDFHFELVGVVPAVGTSREERYYEFSDNRPLRGVNYYRLRTVDADGAFSLSTIRQVHTGFEHGDFRVFPSPVQEVLYVINRVETAGQETTWQIQDVLGRIWLRGASAGSNTWDIPVQALPRGNYVLHCAVDGKVHALRFQKH